MVVQEAILSVRVRVRLQVPGTVVVVIDELWTCGTPYSVSPYKTNSRRYAEIIIFTRTICVHVTSNNFVYVLTKCLLMHVEIELK